MALPAHLAAATFLSVIVPPMVCEGAFKYSANAMYSFVFIGLWGIALLLGSQAALAVVLFQHAYIWVHWYCTEQPDGVVLYGQSPDQ